jgi:hypothetical protein
MYYMLECYGPATQERSAIEDAPHLPRIQWILGNRLTQAVPAPLDVTISPGIMVPMFNRGILLWSDDMIASLRSAGIDNVDYYDAILREPTTGTMYRNYKAANIIGVVGAADLANSSYSAPSGTPIIDTDFDSIAIDTSQARDLLIFRLAECSTAIVVHEKVRGQLERDGLAHLDFVLPAEWIG